MNLPLVLSPASARPPLRGSSLEALRLPSKGLRVRARAPFQVHKSSQHAAHRSPPVPRVAMKVHAASGGAQGSDDLREEAHGLRRIGWISFWSQLALSIVSAVVLFFTATTASRGAFPKLPVFFNLAGVVAGFISTFLAFGNTRIARMVLMEGKQYSKSKVAAGLLRSTRLNLLGMGATIVGLQSTVGGLVGKALTSSSAGAYNLQAAGSAPAALDVFAVQASTNTILLHFIALLFSNWTLRLLNKEAQSPAVA